MEKLWRPMILHSNACKWFPKRDKKESKPFTTYQSCVLLHIVNSFVTRFAVSHALINPEPRAPLGRPTTQYILLALGRHLPSWSYEFSISDQLLLVGIIYLLRFVPRLNHQLLACYRKQGLIHYLQHACTLKNT
jgi:hypothetical protein